MWVLDGNRAERIGRALRAAHEEYRQERCALVDMRELFPTRADECDERIALLDQYMSEARAAGMQHGMTEKQVKEAPKDTDIIAHVARRFAVNQPEPDNMAAAYILSWRSGSAAAHGLIWSSRYRSERVGSVSPGRSHHRLTGGGIDNIAFAVGRVHLLTDSAAQMFNKRRRGGTVAA